MIFKLLITVILLYLLYRITKRFLLPSGKKVKPLPSDQQGENRGEELVEDPICHTYVPLSNALKWKKDGEIMCFCSKECLEKYQIQEKEKREEK